MGRFAPLISGLGFAYTGVDVSPDALRQARQNCANGRFIEADLCTFRPERRFDLVLALFVLIHVVDDGQWGRALDVIAQSIAPGGACILIDKLPREREQPAVHVVCRSRGEYERALARGGLALRRRSSIMPAS